MTFESILDSFEDHSPAKLKEMLHSMGYRSVDSYPSDIVQRLERFIEQRKMVQAPYFRNNAFNGFVRKFFVDEASDRS